ncbi:mitochondrial carrier [Chiua virens]|nr:mitochondrial carrier [Chiua virens]
MPSPYTSTLNDLIAGSFGGAAQVLVGQPLDTVKTRAQIAPKGMFKGPMDILVQTVRKEGFFALYKGMASPLLGIAGVNSLLFAAYVESKRLISPFPDLSISQIALAGGMAGAINAILASPVEMFKVRMQAQYGSASDKRLRNVAMEMWKEWGFTRGIMRGYWKTIDHTALCTAFEFSKRQFQGIYGQQIPAWALLASGSTGGVRTIVQSPFMSLIHIILLQQIAYWLSCYPLDVIKSRIQLCPTPPTSRPWTYMNQELRAVVAEGGLTTKPQEAPSQHMN